MFQCYCSCSCKKWLIIYLILLLIALIFGISVLYFSFFPRYRRGAGSPCIQPSISMLPSIRLACIAAWGHRTTVVWIWRTKSHSVLSSDNFTACPAARRPVIQTFIGHTSRQYRILTLSIPQWKQHSISLHCWFINPIQAHYFLISYIFTYYSYYTGISFKKFVI